MAITRLGGANAITGTLPAANINNTSIGNVTALPAAIDVGSWIKLAETNVTSNTASVEFTDATTGVFDGTYRTHAVLIRRLVPENANVQLTLRMRDASDGNYETASYAYATRGFDSGGSSRNDENTSAGGINTLGAGDGMGDGTGKYGTSCVIYCNDFFDSGMPPSIYGHGAYGDSGGAIAANYYAGTYRDTSIQMDGVQFFFSGGNISQGNFIMYGVQE